MDLFTRSHNWHTRLTWLVKNVLGNKVGQSDRYLAGKLGQNDFGGSLWEI